MSNTKVGTNSIHVSVVSLARERVTRTITIGEKKGSEVSDGREENHDSRTSNPSKLSYRPSQRENSRSYHCGYYVCTCSPQCSCVCHTNHIPYVWEKAHYRIHKGCSIVWIIMVLLCTGSFGATIIVEAFRVSLLMHVKWDVKCLLIILAAMAIHANHLCYHAMNNNPS